MSTGITGNQGNQAAWGMHLYPEGTDAQWRDDGMLSNFERTLRLTCESRYCIESDLSFDLEMPVL